MMKSVKFLTGLIILFSVSCNEGGQQENSSIAITEAEVASFLKTYDDAWNTKNGKVVDSLYASHYRYYTSVGGISTRARNLELLAADYFQIIKASRSEVDISIDGNIAIVSSRWQGNGIWRGEPFHDNQRCGLVIQKTAHGLRLLSEHCVDIATEPSPD